MAIVSNCAVQTPCSSLQIHHAECEVNYLRLQRLLPGFELHNQQHIGMAVGGQTTDNVTLEVVERSPYTASIRLSQERPVWGTRRADLLARAYLDARMAEVISFNRLARRLLPRYEYPNPRMFARDEKAQLNRLFGEWLAACLAHGYALHPVVRVAAD